MSLLLVGYYGSGRRGGQVAQFLVGLAEHPSPNAHPTRFISFCRVGTGLSDDELDAVVTKLKPYFRKYEYPKKNPPSFYQVTNHSKERPDVWVDSPEKSIILSITSDIRTIESEVFAAPYSLRFPRIDRVRYDKAWHECLDVQSFIELVQSSNGTTQRGTEYDSKQDSRPKRMKSSRRGEKNMSIVPSHLIQTDVSSIKGESTIFSNMMFYFVNVPSSHSLDSLHKMVVENGGTFSMNLNSSVTHFVAANSKGFKFEAAKRHGDIIHYTWVLDCCTEKKLVHLQPKYFLFLSELTKKKLQEEIDGFSDSYYLDLNLADLKQLLGNVHVSDDDTAIDHYRKKYCPKDKWCCFNGCSIYFHTSIPSLKGEKEVLLGLALRGLKLEIQMGGGKIANSLACATHLVAFSVPGHQLEFENILRSFNLIERQSLQSKRLHIVGSHWLEDSLESNLRLPEDTYSLKPSGIELSTAEECKDDLTLEAHFGGNNADDGNMSLFSDKGGKRRSVKAINDNTKVLESAEKAGKRKRGRLAGVGSKKARTGRNQAQRSRVHIGKKPAKICEYETDESGSCDEKPCEETDTREEFFDDEKNSELLETEKHPEESSEPLQRDMATKQENSNNIEHEKQTVPEIEMAEVHNDENHHTTEKLEIMTDPVQAMLFDMIPSLSTKKVEETTYRNVEEGKPPESSNVEPLPTKKKKVSYKDIVDDLLKDW